MTGCYQVLACVVALALTSSKAFASFLPKDALDFLIQNVCVDAKDRPVPGDPATCPRHRDLKPFERTPFLRTDNEAGKVYQAITSHPVRSPHADGRNPRIAVPKEFGGDDPSTAFRDFDPCLPGVCKPAYRDGYDILEADGDFVSIVGTSDPGINGQVFWNRNCSGGTEDPTNQEDSWLSFPVNILAKPKGGQLAWLKINQGTGCPWFFNPAWTEWELLPTPFVFTTGKALEAVRSDHFGGRSPTRADHIERFYFTRAYGFTRWERWETGDVFVKAHGCNGATTLIRDGVTFRRTDCRDTTHVIQQAVPYLPDVSGPPWPLSGAPNLVRNSTFAQGRLDGWRVPRSAGAVPSGLAEKNMALSVGCAAACGDSVVSQEILLPPAMRDMRRNLRFGGLFRADRSARLTLRLTLFDDAGRMARRISHPVRLGETFKALDLSATVDLARERIGRMRLELEPATPGARFMMDEIYVIAH